MKKIIFSKFKSLPRPKLFAVLATCFLIYIFHSSLGEEINLRIQNPVDFQLRSAIGLDPQLDNRIKIYSFGDKSLATIGTTEISLNIWSKIISGLSGAGAEYIFIDKLFGTPGTDEEISEFGKSIANLNAKVIIGSYVTEVELKHKDKVDLPEESLIQDRNSGYEYSGKNFVYGAPKLIQSYFKYYGHLNYQNDNQAKGYFPVSDDFAIPTAVLHTAQSVYTKSGQLYVDEKKVPTDSENNILINLAEKDSYARRNYSFKSLYYRARDGVPMKLDAHEKYIVIMLESYTGGTDFVETAHGSMPGGFTHVAILNSILSKNWLSKLDYTLGNILILSLLAYFLAMRLTAKRFIIASFALPILLFMTGFLSFLFLQVQLPWITQSVTFLMVGGIVFFERSRQAEIMNLLLKKDLELGRSAQALFLPDHLSGNIGPYTYSITFKPYGPLSGDWVQTFFQGNMAAIAVGDVVGKGPSAALNTSVIAAVWSQHCDHWQRNGAIDIGPLVKDLSKTIHRMFKGKQFTTFTCVVLMDNELSVFNVGAPPWLCLTPGEGCKSIRLSTKNPLGISEEIQNSAFKTVPLADHEILISYTDGAMDGTGSRRILNSSMKKNNQIYTHKDINNLIFDAGKEERLPDDYTVLIISPTRDSAENEVAA